MTRTERIAVSLPPWMNIGLQQPSNAFVQANLTPPSPFIQSVQLGGWNRAEMP